MEHCPSPSCYSKTHEGYHEIKEHFAEIKSDIRHIVKSIDEDIVARRGIYERLNAAEKKLEAIDERLKNTPSTNKVIAIVSLVVGIGVSLARFV